MKIISLVAALLGFSVPASAQYCATCIQNTASPQNAQMNITSATIRGPLYVGSLVMSTGVFTTSVTAGNFVGSGTFITNLNASQLNFGEVPAPALSGGYTGITGVGVLDSGEWEGSVVSSQYGGTGNNLLTAGAGSVPYFSVVGTMSVVAPGTSGYLFQSGGTGSPVWTSSPSVSGLNVTNIPMANIQTGTVPSSWAVGDVNLSTVSAAKVIGSIPGNSANINGKLALSQLSTGTLVNTIVASSITVTGVTPGYWGGQNQLVLMDVQTDGRIASISQSTFTIYVGSITPGALPSGVTIGASQVTAGTLANNVVASSIAASGVTPGTYGTAANVSSFTVGLDGRLTLAGTVPIAINTSQINNGTLTAGTLVPAANVQSGSLGSGVIASSIAANGVTAGVYGGLSNTVALTIGGNGLVTSATTYFVPDLSTVTAYTNKSNTWVSSQTFVQNIGAQYVVAIGSITAANFYGNGSNMTGVVNTSVYNVFTASQSFPSVAVTYGVKAATAAFSGMVTAAEFSGDGSSVAYSQSQANAIPFVTTSGSTLTFSASGLSYDPVNKRLGIRTATPLHGIDCSSCTLYLDGNAATPIEVGTNGSTMTLTSAGSLTISGAFSAANSSVTGSAFFGDGSHLSNMPNSTKSGFLSATNQALGVGTFSFGYTNQAVTISSMSVIITTSGSGGSSGTIWACCYGGSCVSATSSQGAAIGSTYTSNGAVAVAAGGQIVLQMTSTGESVTPTANVICGYQ